MDKIKKLELITLICKLDNLNQNNIQNNVIDSQTYLKYKNAIHELFDDINNIKED